MVEIFTVSSGGGLRTIGIDELRKIMEGEHSGENAPVIWVDMNNPTSAEEDRILGEILSFHPLAILDCRAERLMPKRGDHLPKVEDYGTYIFSIINPIELAEPDPDTGVDQIVTFQLNAFLSSRMIVTHHYVPSHAVSNALAMCSKNPAHLERGPDYSYHMILDDIVDDISPILDRFDEVIDTLEDDIFSRKSSGTLERILGMKRQVFKLRRITTYQREMVHRLARGEFDLITEREVAYYRNVFDHLVRAAELAESYRDVLTGMLDAYLSMTSNRMNEIMKVLAVISTFFLPLTFIAGVYGMNFNTARSPYNMPELNWFLGYPFAWGVMILISLGMYIYFKRKGWM
jgi:magnesium transporter